MEINEEVVKDWMAKVNEWQKAGLTGKHIVEMTERKEELVNLLSELEKILAKLEPREVLSQLPSVPKLLHALLDNILIQTTENLYNLVMSCVCAVSLSFEVHGQQKDEIRNKSVKWVKSQIKHSCTSNSEKVSSLAGIAEHLGLQPVELTEEINNQLVMSLVDDLRNISCREWSNSRGHFLPTCPIEGITLRNISQMCLPIITSSIARPLVEALLSCHVGSDVMTKSHLGSESGIQVGEALSPHFFEAFSENPKEWYLGLAKGIPLSYEARLGLWMRHGTYFENEILGLLEIACKEKIFISRKELRKMISLRDLPTALSQNISLFSIAFAMIHRTIHETRGNLHIMTFWGTLLEHMNESQRRSKAHENSIHEFNYAAIWNVQLSNLVNLLNIEWSGIPLSAFLHHTKTIQRRIDEICQAGTEHRCDSYYVWLILQGFPKLLHRCYWAMLTETEELVDSCLAILLWYHGGGIKINADVESKIKYFVKTLRLLRRKREVTTNDIVCAVSSIDNLMDHYIGYLIRNLMMVFIFSSPPSQVLNLQYTFAKVMKHLPTYYVLDFLLDWLEETLGFRHDSSMDWPNVKCFSKTTEYIELLHHTYTEFNEFVNHQAGTMPEDMQLNIFDLRQRFETVCKMLTK